MEISLFSNSFEHFNPSFYLSLLMYIYISVIWEFGTSGQNLVNKGPMPHGKNFKLWY